MTRTQTVEVLLPYALEGPYTYLVPDDLDVAEGDYVRVPLGPRHVIGVVWGSGRPPPDKAKLRPIAERYDVPPLSPLMRRFIDWVAAYYLEAQGSILRLGLRAPGVFGGPKETVAYIRGNVTPDRLTPQRRRVLDAAAQGFPMKAGELAQEAGTSTAVVKGLVEAGALVAVALPAFQPFRAPDPDGERVDLTGEQQAAAAMLRETVEAEKFAVTLLDGVTGSGKTEVYFEAMAEAFAQGRQVLLLLPEIALTGSFLERIERRFRAAPAEWHSGVRPRERERVWRAVSTGEAKIVVGARSALFLPWQSLGLIVVDEEHEAAFKQEDGANYHARDMAVVLGSLGRFPVVLSSATPSLESLVNADRGRYAHVHLKRRAGSRPDLPPLDLIDMRFEGPSPGQWLAPRLVEEIARTLKEGDQALLFLNRRGYAPLTLCRACGHRIHCPNCAAWLVEHRFRRILMCHHCGHQEPVPEACPKCGATHALVPLGPGIERVAEEAKVLFPEAAITVLSSDLSRGTLLKDALRDAAEGRYNLIVGTQLVAKGHHFPHLTFSGVIDADLALETTDPRAGERTWQVLAQVAGRAGRGERPGRALVQTYLPGHPLMQALKRGDRDGFLAHERKIREAAGMPPFGRLAAVIVSGEDPVEAERFAGGLARLIPSTKDVTVLGPAPAPLAVIQGRHRFRFLVKSARDVDIQAFLRAWLAGARTRGTLRLAIDVDPYSFQ
ncbi:MAG: primosomal protein N' [Hyphomicrobiales bacterium]